jgi:lipopolysaccharide transport system ATP-binding protein
MTKIAVRAHKLGKQYRITARRPNRSLAEAIGNALRNPLGGVGGMFARGQGNQPIWALRDISFELAQNDVIGIIGRNGSGKTTLLKLLTGVTDPTEGKAEIVGRSASLLEVGTGFHPELTGRENIYLNGTILGMRRGEIDRKFDEIVDFSEIGEFLDTPVKRYSSGMTMRLAFSVAAHLEPELLMIDEVLAVGDLKFQKKCVEKMGSVVGKGKTILFVSHHMHTIRRLCSKTLWLEDGAIKMLGPTPLVVSAYEDACLRGSPQDETGIPRVTGFGGWKIDESADGQPNLLTSMGPVTIRLTLKVKDPIREGQHGIALKNSEDDLVWGHAVQNLKLDPGTHEFVYRLPSLPLRPGSYRFFATLAEGYCTLDQWHGVPDLIVGTTPGFHSGDEWVGILNLPCEFDISRRS